eukprot:7607958-Pyramimonas_sp.AAC.2
MVRCGPPGLTLSGPEIVGVDTVDTMKHTHDHRRSMNKMLHGDFYTMKPVRGRAFERGRAPPASVRSALG